MAEMERAGKRVEPHPRRLSFRMILRVRKPVMANGEAALTPLAAP